MRQEAVWEMLRYLVANLNDRVSSNTAWARVSALFLPAPGHSAGLVELASVTGMNVIKRRELNDAMHPDHHRPKEEDAA